MEFPTAIFRVDPLNVEKNFETDYTTWLVMSEAHLKNIGDAHKQHMVRNVVKSQVQLMLSWKKHVADFVETRAFIEIDGCKLKIIIQKK